MVEETITTKDDLDTKLKNLENLDNNDCKFHFIGYSCKEDINIFDISNLCIEKSSLPSTNIENIENINFSETKITDKLNIVSYDKEIKDIIFSNCTFCQHSSLDFNVKDEVKIGNIKFKNIKAYSKELTISGIKASGDFVLNDVGKNIRLKNLDVSMCKKISFENIENIENMFEDVKWGEIKASRFEGTTNIFRALKTQAEGSKNYIDAAKFYALEMSSKLKDIRADRKQSNNPIKFFIAYELILIIYEFFSDFATNWIKPLMYLIFSIMLYEIFYHANETMMAGCLVFTAILLYLPLLKNGEFANDNYYIYNILPILKISLLFLSIAVYSIIPQERYINNSQCTITSKTDNTEDIDTNKLSKNLKYVCLAKTLNPFGVLRGSNKFTFFELIFKLYLLFLLYQIGLSIKKLVRSQ